MDQSAMKTLLSAVEGVKCFSIIDGHDGGFVSIPKDYRMESVEVFQKKPNRVQQSVTLHELDSFIAFAKRFQTPESVIFMDASTGKIKAIFDYHGSSSPTDAQWRDNEACFSPVLDKRWKAWTNNNQAKMDQSDFAEFIENALQDINKPTGAEMLEIATKFHLIRKAAYSSSVRLNSGEVQFQYSDEHTKGTVEIPEKITLAIPVFQGGCAYEVEARIRYRLKEQQLTFWYELINQDDVKEHAIKKIRERITNEIQDVPVFI